MKLKKIAELAGVILISLLISSCATLFTKGGSAYRNGAKAYENKDYITAVEELISALEKNPEFTEALELFPRAFNEGTEYYLSQSSGTPEATNTKASLRIVKGFENLVELHRIAGDSGRNDITVQDFSAELAEAKENNLETHYNLGTELLADGSMDSARRAVEILEYLVNLEPGYRDAEDQLSAALEKAICTVMVYGQAGIQDYQTGIEHVLLEEFETNRFIKILESTETKGSSLDTAITYGKAHGIDYLISLQENSSFQKYSNREDISIPEDTPFFPAIRSTQGYTIDFTCDIILYRLSDTEILHNETSKNTENREISIEYVEAEGMKEGLSFDDTGSHNLRYISYSSDDSYNFQMARYDIECDYKNITTPSSISDETSISEWKDYFVEDNYSLYDLSSEFNDLRLFYAIEVIYNTENDGYTFIGGETITDAINFSERNSAIMNGLSKAATAFIEKEEDSAHYGGYFFAKRAAEILRKTL